jgi:hypothetical protein
MPDAPPLFRRARAEDVPAIVRLLADDPLGRTRERDETPLPPSYLEAFAAIDRDPNNELVVACRDAAVVGVLQLTFMPSITYQGGWRAQIEGVRVDARERSHGLGARSFSGPSRGRGSAAATWCSSPPTRRGRTPGASTRAWASWPPTRA